MAVTGGTGGFTARGLPPTGLAALLARPGLRDALLATGSGLLAQADQPGSIGGALGRALPLGAQAFKQGQQKAEFEKLLSSAPPQMRQLLAMLGPERGIPALMQLMQPQAPVAVPADTTLVNPGTLEEVYRNTPPAAPADPRAGLSSEMRDALFILGGEPGEFTDEQRAVAQRIASEIRQSGRGPLVTVETGDRAASAAGQALGGDAASRVVSKAGSAETAIGIVDNVRRAEEMLKDPAMQQVTGPGASIKTILERFADDPRARQLAAQFDILTSDIVLGVISSFKGSLSDKELAFIERASASDRNMTIEELQAGLGLIGRIAESDIRSYVDEVEGFDPAAFDVTEDQIRQYKNLADRARAVLAPTKPMPGASTPEGRRLLELLRPKP